MFQLCFNKSIYQKIENLKTVLKGFFFFFHCFLFFKISYLEGKSVIFMYIFLVYLKHLRVM